MQRTQQIFRRHAGAPALAVGLEHARKQGVHLGQGLLTILCRDRSECETDMNSSSLREENRLGIRNNQPRLAMLWHQLERPAFPFCMSASQGVSVSTAISRRPLNAWCAPRPYGWICSTRAGLGVLSSAQNYDPMGRLTRLHASPLRPPAA